MVECEILEILRKIEMTIGQRYLYRPPAPPLPLAPTISLPMAPATPLLPLVPISELHVPTEPSFYQEPPPTPPINHPEPLPLNHMYFNTPLTSEQIPKHTLMSVEDSLKGCKELKSVEKASTETSQGSHIWSGDNEEVHSRGNKGVACIAKRGNVYSKEGNL